MKNTDFTTSLTVDQTPQEDPQNIFSTNGEQTHNDENGYNDIPVEEWDLEGMI